MKLLPKEWESATLAEVAALGSGGTPQARNPGYYGGQILWAVIGDLKDGIVSSTQQQITQAGLDKSSAKVVPPNTLLLAMYGSIGKLGITGTAMATNQAIATISPSARIDVGYLFYYLLGQRRELDAAGKGATQRNISQTVLRPWPIRFPTEIDHQRRIVDLLEEHLSHLDAAMASIKVGTRRLTALRRSALAELHEGPSKPLGDLAIDAGYGTSAKCVENGPGPAVVRIPNLVDGSINLDDEKRIADPGTDVSRYTLSAGDVLIVRTNGSVDLIGRSAVVPHGVEAAYASYLIRYRVDESRVRPAWVQAMLSAPQVRARIGTLAASSAGQHNLSLGKLNPLELPVPSLAVQDAGLRRFAELELEVSRLQTAAVTAGQRADRLRSALLAAAFSGRLIGVAKDASNI